MISAFPHEFFNAYTFGFCEKKGFTRGQGWRWSLQEMQRSTGCSAIILPVCAWQDHTYSTKIDSTGPDVMDDEDVRAVCDLAKALGLRVILKAMVNCRDGYWRAYIHFLDSEIPTEPMWKDWFKAYSDHVCHVADMARENGADMLCVGCEMVGTDHREKEWRALVRLARQHYGGPVTYNCDKYQENYVTWWDELDAISSSGYYPLREIGENFARIEKVARSFDRPFLFMECGCPSRQGSENRPNDWGFGGSTDMAPQREWYRAFTEAVLAHPFVRGVGWWDWPATRLYPAPSGPDLPGYCTYGKDANDVLLSFSEALKK